MTSCVSVNQLLSANSAGSLWLQVSLKLQSKQASLKLENHFQVHFTAIGRHLVHGVWVSRAANAPRVRKAGDSQDRLYLLAPTLRGDVTLYSHI